eukprot:SAG11_NODE_3331_length_2520_cov_3.661710_1_plen_57_part_00
MHVLVHVVPVLNLVPVPVLNLVLPSSVMMTQMRLNLGDTRTLEASAYWFALQHPQV